MWLNLNVISFSMFLGVLAHVPSVGGMHGDVNVPLGDLPAALQPYTELSEAQRFCSLFGVFSVGLVTWVGTI